MGRAAVRSAIQSYLQGAQIPYLGSVYPARPAILPEDAYTATMSGQAIAQSANGSSCVAVVNIVSDRRVRRAAVGRGSVDDTNVHDVVVELFFASSSGEGITAQQDYDTVVDALIVAIRDNATPGGLWSVGEFTAGVVHEQSEPFQSDDGMTVSIAGLLRFEAWEWVVGQGV